MTTLPRPVVRLVVCGNADRGDDGAALTAAATLLPSLTPLLASRIEVRRCPNLRTEDLLDLPDGVQAVIIDAVIGPPPGELVRVPLCALAARAAFTPRSSHQLPIDLAVGLAGVIRKRPVPGTFIGLSGHRFGFGTPLSRAVRAGLPAFRAAIEAELEAMAASTSVPELVPSVASESGGADSGAAGQAPIAPGRVSAP
jgi:hydrogenase maturation protease